MMKLEVGYRVEILKDIEFDYGTVAKQGERDLIHKIDGEGYWLREKQIYITHGSEQEYLKSV